MGLRSVGHKESDCPHFKDEEWGHRNNSSFVQFRKLPFSRSKLVRMAVALGITSCMAAPALDIL